MANDQFPLTILTPEATLKYQVVSINVPALEGRRGLLLGCAPQILQLISGTIEIFERLGEFPQRWLIESGLCHMDMQGACTITTLHLKAMSAHPRVED